MRTRLKNTLSGVVRAGLCSAIALGFTSGSVLAVEVSEEDYKLLQKIKQQEAEKKQPAHELPDRFPAVTGGQAKPAVPGGHADLAAAATNPIANLVQFQIQNSYSPSNYNADGYSNVGVIQPVVPIKMPWEKVPLLVTRTTLPYVSTPDLDGGIGRKDGFGDIVAQGYFLPKLETKGVAVGLGYNLTIPSAGDNEFVGSGKWSIGPGAVYLNMQTPSWQWGLLSYASFSFASADADRDHVSNIAVQPILTKHLSDGWYVSAPDVPQTYDFRTNKWQLQLGPRVGKVTKLGKQAVNLFVQATYNPLDHDDIVAPEWTIKANLTLLFPE